MQAANSSRCSRASSTPTSWSCSNCGRTRRRSTPTPNCRRSARLCRRGCGSALASARTISITAPAEPGRRQNAGLVFRNRPLLRALEPAAGMADAGRRLRPRGGLARLSRHGRAQPICRGTGVRLGQRLRASLFPAHSDPVAADRRGLHRLACTQDQDRAARADCAAEQPGTARRGNGDARHDGRGPADRRHAARHTNEMLTYDLNPEESRERTDEGMELILRAWREPQPFGWQGRHFRYRTVSVWPKPLQQPLPPMYALGTSSEASDFAARNHIGLGVSFGPFDAMGRVTGYYKEQCAHWGWQPEPHQIIYRANILIAETDEKAQQALAQYPRAAVFPLKAGVGAALLELDQRNVAGEGRRPANVNRVLPMNFCGGPDEIVAQLKQCREQIGAGVVDLSFQTPGSEHPDQLMEALELFGKKVLPHIRDI